MAVAEGEEGGKGLVWFVMNGLGMRFLGNTFGRGQNWILILMGALLFGGRAGAAPLRVSSDFEGGSVRNVSVIQESRTVEFMPGGDPVRGWPCWWYFKLEGVSSGEVLTLRLRASDATVPEAGRSLSKPLASSWSMPNQAAYSLDGSTWFQTEKGVRDGKWMTYALAVDASAVWVAWGPPYTPRGASEFVKAVGSEQRGALATELCRSREGRSVPMLKVQQGARSAEKRFGVWVQARQHAWESGSSWVAQGFSEWLLSDRAEAQWLREHAEVFIVPIMDVDNVATGNGGKDASPHDHNRDWSDAPHWRETIAAQRIVRSLTEEGRMDVFLDLHNPGAGDPTFFYLLNRDMLPEPARGLRDRFIELSYGRISQGQPFIPMSNRPKFTGPDYHPLWRQISANWVSVNANAHTVAVCLETIWNCPSSNTEGYRAVGARLAQSVRDYLVERPVRE